MLFVSLLCTSLLMYMLPAQAQRKSTVPGSPWPAVDTLGRELPLTLDVGPPRKDRFVGIFYFLWHDNPDIASPHWSGPYDVSRILQKDPDACARPTRPTGDQSGCFTTGENLSTDTIMVPTPGFCAGTRICWQRLEWTR